jgi:hydroxymethylglutaryl-CoA lyase
MNPEVRLFEVSLRDGLQNEAVVVPTERKLELVNRLVAAGFRDIEVTSFVRPKWVPQLADASEVVRNLPDAPGVRFWALVPNAIGLDRALDAGVGHIATFMSSSETHNQKNLNRTTQESLAGLRKVIGTAKAEGVQVRAYLSTVFGCPFEGEVSVDAVTRLVLALLEAGADEVALGDTTGMAHPTQVQRILAHLTEQGVPLERTALHFHDTRGTALVNVAAAYAFGARLFDGALSGVGGCPYAPGAAGNACTQDLVHYFERLDGAQEAPEGHGPRTGIDLDQACEAGKWLEDVLGRDLPGRYHQFWRGQERRKVRSA